jgi:Holliday junction resolvase RusA-like endonuclease
VTALSFFVPGIPRPQGSKRAFLNRRTGRPILVESSKGNGSWRVDVATCARAAVQAAGWTLLTGPVVLEARFRFQRPKGHWGRRGLLPSAPPVPFGKPDLSKLVRSIEDALTGIAYRDDAQIVWLELGKGYGEPGVEIAVRAWVEQAAGREAA